MKPLLSTWWDANTTDSQLDYMKWISTFFWVVCCVALLRGIVATDVFRVAMNVGYIAFLTPYMLGPQCWKVFEAKEGSTSRALLTAVALFGFLLAMSATIASFLPAG
ncbi:MAG: hypothetical protein ING75_03195 [Rhodocyclaceae bacterium]|nr:hypothetical protein [Rhodocyclaceae bacterium]